jgi:hypothetical protein
MQGPRSAPHQPNLRNPLPLSAAQEAQVKDIYYKRVRGHCAQEIKGWLHPYYSRLLFEDYFKSIDLNCCI